MKTDISSRLPSRIRQKGGVLTEEVNGTVTKFTLICAKLKYRGFIYVMKGRDADGTLKDLYNNFYYENNIGVISNN